MQKTAEYHTSAIHYNKVLADTADRLVGEVTDPTVKKWITGISKLHKKHLGLHEIALERLEQEESNSDVPASTETNEEKN
jgi:hypothetical protein